MVVYRASTRAPAFGAQLQLHTPGIEAHLVREARTFARRLLASTPTSLFRSAQFCLATGRPLTGETTVPKRPVALYARFRRWPQERAAH